MVFPPFFPSDATPLRTDARMRGGRTEGRTESHYNFSRVRSFVRSLRSLRSLTPISIGARSKLGERDGWMDGRMGG